MRRFGGPERENQQFRIRLMVYRPLLASPRSPVTVTPVHSAAAVAVAGYLLSCAFEVAFPFFLPSSLPPFLPGVLRLHWLRGSIFWHPARAGCSWPLRLISSYRRQQPMALGWSTLTEGCTSTALECEKTAGWFFNHRRPSASLRDTLASTSISHPPGAADGSIDAIHYPIAVRLG